MVKVKQIDFGWNELGTCEHNELRRDMSCYRGEKLARLVLANLDKYKTVADVPQVSAIAMKNLENAYRLTNTVEQAWFENPEIYVAEIAQNGCRSTSVGDIIEFAGVTYMVDGYGMLCLDDVESIENLEVK